MKFLSLLGGVAVIVSVAAAGFFFDGFYNIAATQADLPPSPGRWSRSV
jgi:hypothetical protein